MDACSKQETPGSETKELIAYSTSSNMSFTVARVLIMSGSSAEQPRWMLHEKPKYFIKGVGKYV